MTEELKKEILRLRKQIIENEFIHLNPQQREAALALQGPLLILAGAGSGKTTVLVNRVAHILRWGEAYESDDLYGEYSEKELSILRQAANGQIEIPVELVDKLSVSRVAPWRILAITFTNKAANELKERICAKVGEQGKDIWASTFHACCTRILRRYGEALGYTAHFTIYDTDDQKRLLRDCMRSIGIDEKILPIKMIMAELSNAKDSMLTPDAYRQQAAADIRQSSIAKVYTLYQKRLLAADAMDFDDIIFNTITLFRQCPEALEKYAEQFRYIMVDEYQDTNNSQYILVNLLAARHRNLCVVGDDDQSIYRFRGATIRNILEFEQDYEHSRCIKLEQNYRSTQNILSAANSVIGNNYERKQKTLWTQNEPGDKLIVYTAMDDRDESDYIASTIKEQAQAGAKYADFAVLYRMNSQSQGIERALVHADIPYRIIGGRRFYERKEIRDMISYLAVISNPHDNIRLKRIINVPKRGIGDKTVASIEEISATLGQSMLDTMRQSQQFEVLVKSSKKLLDFCAMIDRMNDLLETIPAHEMYEQLLKELDYEQYLIQSNDYTETALDNVHQLATAIAQYEEDNGDEATLQGFLEETALMTDIDAYSEKEDCVVLMTLHSAKGLEFENVFIPGMEENIFPGYQSTLNQHEMQEERRLAYVGLTRAKKHLYLIHANSRMVFGHTNRNRPSRFITEIPDTLKEAKHKVLPPSMLTQVNIPTPKEVRKADIAFSRTITPTSVPKTNQSFSVGMRVSHKSFGEGTILDIKPMGSDFMLEIAFDTIGTKKLMSNYAKLTVLE
ncbi:MAG: UvrD-helicase domain-containing protein [Clostridia bacterium]|nr:UvrD-helicase domain-containing protein [Clostridia bacterium]